MGRRKAYAFLFLKGRDERLLHIVDWSTVTVVKKINLNTICFSCSAPDVPGLYTLPCFVRLPSLPAPS